MNLPKYATTGQRIGYFSFMTYCGLVFFFPNRAHIYCVTFIF